MTETAELPAFPQARPASCPFDPPSDYRDWMGQPGLQRVRLWDGTTPWLLTRYEDIRAALSDPRVSADGTNPGLPHLPPTRNIDSTRSREELSLFQLDEPEHSRQRRMVAGYLTVKRAEEMRPQIQELVDSLLDQMIAKGQPGELVADFALPLPSRVIAMLLGVPPEDHKVFQDAAGKVLNLAISPEAARAGYAELAKYLATLIDGKEREPGGDLISRLLADRVAAGELTRRQVGTMAHAMLVAGHETTANMIALGTLTLLRNPSQLERLRAADDPALYADTAEELLRYLSIVENVMVRVAAEDLTIGGQLVRAGEGLVISLPAGNRDAGFLQDADTFDIGHSARGHIAFGYGAHQCLGQNLARVEIQVALRTLLRRLPGLRLAEPFEEVPFRQAFGVYGLNKLPVEW